MELLAVSYSDDNNTLLEYPGL